MLKSILQPYNNFKFGNREADMSPYLEQAEKNGETPTQNNIEAAKKLIDEKNKPKIHKEGVSVMGAALVRNIENQKKLEDSQKEGGTGFEVLSKRTSREANIKIGEIKKERKELEVKYESYLEQASRGGREVSQTAKLRALDSIRAQLKMPQATAEQLGIQVENLVDRLNNRVERIEEIKGQNYETSNRAEALSATGEKIAKLREKYQNSEASDLDYSNKITTNEKLQQIAPQINERYNEISFLSGQNERKIANENPEKGREVFDKLLPFQNEKDITWNGRNRIGETMLSANKIIKNTQNYNNIVAEINPKRSEAENELAQEKANLQSLESKFDLFKGGKIKDLQAKIKQIEANINTFNNQIDTARSNINSENDSLTKKAEQINQLLNELPAGYKEGFYTNEMSIEEIVNSVRANLYKFEQNTENPRLKEAQTELDGLKKQENKAKSFIQSYNKVQLATGKNSN
jgi:chromosome segregation ATPase